MSLSATSTLLVVAPTFPPLAGGLYGAEVPEDPYIVEVVTKVGVVRVVLDDAFPGDIVETINAMDEFPIVFPRSSYTKDDVDVLGNSGGGDEIRVRLGDKVLAWGPAVSSPGGGSGSGDVQLDCRGVDWYFAKRAIDEEPVNLISNGGFESDLTDWRDSGTAPGGSGTIGDNTLATIVTDPVFEGSKAVQLEAVFAPTGLALVSKAQPFTSGPLGNDLALSFSFVLQLFGSAALYNAGVLLLAGPPGPSGAVAGGVNAKRSALYRIDDTTPTGVEVRAGLKVHIPKNRSWVVQVWLFSPNGFIVYDNFFLRPLKQLSTAMISGSPTAVVDVSRVVQLLADHALTDRHNKSDLHIAVDAPLCGVRDARVYAFDDHTFFDQALGEFLQRDDCFEYRMIYTQTTRTLRLYPIASGGMGVDRSADVTLTLGQPPFASYSPTIDGGPTVTQSTVLGDGSGLTREEAWATDATEIGGTILQGNTSAVPGSRYDSLPPTARAEIAKLGRPASVLEITITRESVDIGGTPTILADSLDLGDRVMVDIPDGWHTYTGKWRIVRRTRLTRARKMKYTLNPVPA